jgi:hypothetical protein
MKYKKPDRQEMEAWINELTKENDRLRKVLREISMDMPTGRSARIAREALKHDL